MKKKSKKPEAEKRIAWVKVKGENSMFPLPYESVYPKKEKSGGKKQNSGPKVTQPKEVTPKSKSEARRIAAQKAQKDPTAPNTPKLPIPNVRKFHFEYVQKQFPFTKEIDKMDKELGKRVDLLLGRTPKLIKKLLGWNDEWLAAPRSMLVKLAEEAYPVLKGKDLNFNPMAKVISYTVKKKVLD